MSTPPRTQVITVKTNDRGKHYWHCEGYVWVPKERVELNAKQFRVGTTVTVKEPK